VYFSFCTAVFFFIFVLPSDVIKNDDCARVFYDAERVLSEIAKFLVHLFGEGEGRGGMGEGRVGEERGEKGGGYGGAENGNTPKYVRTVTSLAFPTTVRPIVPLITSRVAVTRATVIVCIIVVRSLFTVM